MALTLNGSTGLSGIVGSAGTPALQGTDTNTGYFFGTDILGLSTGGSERLRVDSNGNVSLGNITAAPTSTAYNSGTLHLHQATGGASGGSQLKMTTSQSGAAAGDGAYLAYYGNNELYIYNKENADISFGTNALERLRITSDGKVGINRNNPVAPITARRLDAGGTGTDGVIAEFANSSGYGVWFGQSSASGASWGATTGDFYWNTGGLSSQVERLRIKSNGQIGINMAPSADAQVCIKNSDDSNFNVLDFYNDNGNKMGGFSQDSTGNGSMGVRTNAGVLNTFFRSSGISYLNGGNVGIGTVSPSTKLSLEGSSGTTSHGILIGAKNAGGIRGVVEVHTAASTVGFNLSRTGGGSDTDVVRLEMDADSHGLIQVRNSSNAQRVRLDNHGIKFGTDTAAANALDDYEEGTFSPGWFDDGGNFVTSFSTQYGQYTKIGNVVYFCFGLRIGTFSRTPNATQICRVGNLPFVSREVGDDEECVFNLYARLWGSGTPPETARIRQSSGSGSNHVEFFMDESQTGNDHTLKGEDFDSSATCRVIVNGFYYTS